MRPASGRWSSGTRSWRRRHQHDPRPDDRAAKRGRKTSRPPAPREQAGEPGHDAAVIDWVPVLWVPVCDPRRDGARDPRPGAVPRRDPDPTPTPKPWGGRHRSGSASGSVADATDRDGATVRRRREGPADSGGRSSAPRSSPAFPLTVTPQGGPPGEAMGLTSPHQSSWNDRPSRVLAAYLPDGTRRRTPQS